MALPEKPILFYYKGSVYSQRVLCYLWLRGIEFDECIQPPVMPRPDLSSLDVAYRRIPLMAIGKDVYCDSRLIISKLESTYPNSTLAPATSADAGVRKLFESWTVDGGIFINAVKLMPYWTPGSFLSNEAFVDDRAQLSGRRMTAELMKAGRPNGLQHIRQALDMLENTFLADDRKWILDTKEPSLADLDAIWPFAWLILDQFMKGALSEEHINETIYPKTYAWVRRFMVEVEKGKGRSPEPNTLDGKIMSNRILGSSTSPEVTTFIVNDPLMVQAGDEVEVFPSDYGQNNKDRGTLVGLTTHEVVIRNKKGLHLHFPRWNYCIEKLAPDVSIPASISSVEKVPKMRLIYHYASPYTRKVFMLAHELGLAKHITLEKVVVCPISFPGWSDNNDDVAKFNPLAKIPCLVSDDVPGGIFDSRVICEYLSSLAPIKPKKDANYWQLRTLHACADGILDASVLVTYEERIRKERGLYFDEWVQGQALKISRALDRFESAANEGVLPVPGTGPASVDEIAVAVALVVTEKMGYLGVKWREGRPKLVEWMSKWEGRGSFLETPPSKEWTIKEDAGGSSKI
ncbi:hypothetical protein P153DRAFT_429100 [Dothidotthia symphoricarpi CBS 119687]|uniref:GST N-terminal domain-containing protein n=1 Tax=Dothidotthia symphoricarpi CBS 119687 TaxID=1392245 RepID=A0A6A6AKX0_9PLEO|nr:uncharacterized protein P153DRAFT_429100 [Dothidotthia symphoricarpi CBS 119687]KAF2131843.1 hypothetical protein P153DRAFT_429100 [Dothidotthia symphoricarpi CBS 119687]